MSRVLRVELGICHLSGRVLAIVVAAPLRQRMRRRHRDRLKKEKDPNEHSIDQLTLFLIVLRLAYLADNCAASLHAALPVRVVSNRYYAAV